MLKKNRDRKRQISHRTIHVINERAKEKQRLKDEIDEENLDCDKAIVCFETQKEMEEAYQKIDLIKRYQLEEYFHGQNLKVEKAARPK